MPKWQIERSIKPVTRISLKNLVEIIYTFHSVGIIARPSILGKKVFPRKKNSLFGEMHKYTNCDGEQLDLSSSVVLLNSFLTRWNSGDIFSFKDRNHFHYNEAS